jgi:hypothetical protein
MSAFIGFGHSHVVALANGFDDIRREAEAPFSSFAAEFHYLYSPEFVPNCEHSGGRPVLNARVLDALARSGGAPVILSLGGNEHNVLSILQFFEKFDFILGDRPDLPLQKEVEIYPEAMMRETLRDWMGDSLCALRAFRDASEAPMVQIEPPPPIPKAHILAHPGELLPDPKTRGKIAPEWVRHKIWRVATRLYRETCAATGVDYIAVPPQTLDADGMLAAPYLGADATHANAAFGRMMLKIALLRLTKT